MPHTYVDEGVSVTTLTENDQSSMLQPQQMRVALMDLEQKLAKPDDQFLNGFAGTSYS